MALGLGGAFVLGTFASGMLFHVEPSDPLTLFTVAATLAAVALLACSIPAHRAAHLDPLIALRRE